MSDIEPSCWDRCEGVFPSLCDGDTNNNYWVEGGICMLDTGGLTKAAVIGVIQHNPRARLDLARVTTCLEIHQLLAEVPLLSTIQEDDAQQSEFNKADCLPYYTIFRGSTTDR
jgi:hypothetical protein